MTSECLHWSVQIGDEKTTAICEAGHGGTTDTLFVCAHGAGGHMQDSRMQSLAQALRARGIAVVRFNFLYREQGARRPDPMPRLKTCMTAVIEHARTAIRPATLVIGGRSMGGRTASMLAADGTACDGLLLFAYPLHPAGKPDKLRDAHLGEIRVPVLSLNGTRDTLCERELMDAVVAPLGSRWQMHWLGGADHSFHVLKSSGRSDPEVLNEAADAVERWMHALHSSGKRPS